MDFNQRLKYLRLLHDETQAQLGDAIGISDKQIQRFEYGMQKPGFSTLWALADHFGVSVDYLMGRKDE